MNLPATISLCLQNDRVAQRKLYDSYKDNLYTIAVRLTNDIDQANDLLQDTFIEAFKNLAKLKEPLYFHSWIKKILVRKTYYYLNHVKKSVSLESVELSQREKIDVGYIEQAIQALPTKSRTVFVMCEVEGFSHKEIAEAMDITIGTSKSQLNYAKTKLKDMLKPHLH